MGRPQEQTAHRDDRVVDPLRVVKSHCDEPAGRQRPSAAGAARAAATTSARAACSRAGGSAATRERSARSICLWYCGSSSNGLSISSTAKGRSSRSALPHEARLRDEGDVQLAQQALDRPHERGKDVGAPQAAARRSTRPPPVRSARRPRTPPRLQGVSTCASRRAVGGGRRRRAGVLRGTARRLLQFCVAQRRSRSRAPRAIPSAATCTARRAWRGGLPRARSDERRPGRRAGPGSGSGSGSGTAPWARLGAGAVGDGSSRRRLLFSAWSRSSLDGSPAVSTRRAGRRLRRGDAPRLLDYGHAWQTGEDARLVALLLGAAMQEHPGVGSPPRPRIGDPHRENLHVARPWDPLDRRHTKLSGWRRSTRRLLGDRRLTVFGRAARCFLRPRTPQIDVRMRLSAACGSSAASWR